MWKNILNLQLPCYPQAKKKQGLYTPLLVATKSCESISMYFLSSFSTSQHGINCVFALVDQFSKMAIMISCNKVISVEETTKFYFNHVWLNFGLPKSTISYQESMF